MTALWTLWLLALILSPCFSTDMQFASRSDFSGVAEVPGLQSYPGQNSEHSRTRRSRQPHGGLPALSPPDPWYENNAAHKNGRLVRSPADSTARLLFPYLTPAVAVAPGLVTCGTSVAYQLSVFGTLRPVLVRLKRKYRNTSCTGVPDFYKKTYGR
ncbi:uncharacterized protein LOC142572726 isoform X3 [Dermacentor variabilis]